jgi:prepilin-type N-terminal cleavage/methylation domain-containing protein
MLDRLHQVLGRADDHRDAKARQGGFTLIELLVVITILGILAAVVVFSVAGVGDKGQAAACKTDTVTIKTAEESNFALHGTYAPLATLVSNGLLSTTSTLHTVGVTPVAGPVFTAYTVGNIAPCADN